MECFSLNRKRLIRLNRSVACSICSQRLWRCLSRHFFPHQQNTDFGWYGNHGSGQSVAAGVFVGGQRGLCQGNTIFGFEHIDVDCHMTNHDLGHFGFAFTFAQCDKAAGDELVERAADIGFRALCQMS